MGNGKTLAYFYEENRVHVELDRRADHAAGDDRDRGSPLLRARRPGRPGHDACFITNSPPAASPKAGPPSPSSTSRWCRSRQARKGDSQGQAAQAPTMQRKIRELRYAIAMEKKFSKDEILERYLNIAYFGDGRVRRRGRGPALLLHHGRQADPGPGGHVGRTGAEPGRLQPGGQPERGARPAQRRAQPDGRTRVDHARQAGGEAGRLRRETGDDDSQWLRRHPLPVPLRLRRRTPAQRAEPRQDTKRTART